MKKGSPLIEGIMSTSKEEIIQLFKKFTHILSIEPTFRVWLFPFMPTKYLLNIYNKAIAVYSDEVYHIIY